MISICCVGFGMGTMLANFHMKKKKKCILLRHMIHKRNYDKNIAHTIMRLCIQYNTIYNFIIIMVIGNNSNMTADMLPPIKIKIKIIKRL